MQSVDRFALAVAWKFELILFVVSGMAILQVLLAKSSLPMIYRWLTAIRCYGFLWPFLWMTAARCANAAAGFFPMVAWWCKAKCLLHLCMGMCYDVRMHVSVSVEPGKFHNEWTV